MNESILLLILDIWNSINQKNQKCLVMSTILGYVMILLTRIDQNELQLLRLIWQCSSILKICRCLNFNDFFFNIIKGGHFG